MKIICAGMWKTGTKSLAEALKILGYTVYDYDDQGILLEKLWTKFFDGTVTDDDIRTSLQDVDVLIDGAVIAFWEEIFKAIPEAKVILSTRDEESWWQSFRGMQMKTPLYFKMLFLVVFLLPSGNRFIRNALRTGRYILGVDGLFELPFVHFGDKARLHKFKFRQHNSHVLRAVPAEKLLVYPVGSGWKPLCDFLCVEIPDVPYPYKNKDGAHFTTEGGPKNPKLRQIAKEAAVLLAIIVCLAATASYYVISKIF